MYHSPLFNKADVDKMELPDWHYGQQYSRCYAYFMSNEAPKNIREQARDQVVSELSKNERKILETDVNWKQVDLDRFKMNLDARMNSVKNSGGWIGFRKEFSSESSFTDEDRDVVETSISILHSFEALSDKDSVLKRATNKLPEIAQASRILKSKSGTTELVGYALESLLSAVRQFATDQEIEASFEGNSGVMTAQEVQEAKERASKMNIS